MLRTADILCMLIHGAHGVWGISVPAQLQPTNHAASGI